VDFLTNAAVAITNDGRGQTVNNAFTIANFGTIDTDQRHSAEQRHA